MAEIEAGDLYGLFIMESNVDDWITDHGHPKDADLSLMTGEGTDYIYLPYVNIIRYKPEFNIDILDFFEGAGVDISLAEGHLLFMANGRFGGTSEANRNLKMENLMLLYRKHLKGSDEQLYLGYRKKPEVWEPFVNTARVAVYYLKGKLIDASYERSEDELFYNWKIAFRGVW
ncbi:hypothetical protein LCGC14_1229820 [marine sediment metagenome]|uniref:Uncharacterized protein n=1 Tax=marine sediment metagenome TaxID=412755 RepID=A0A0F9LW13_9ZZZZ